MWARLHSSGEPWGAVGDGHCAPGPQGSPLASAEASAMCPHSWVPSEVTLRRVTLALSGVTCRVDTPCCKQPHSAPPLPVGPEAGARNRRSDRHTMSHLAAAWPPLPRVGERQPGRPVPTQGRLVRISEGLSQWPPSPGMASCSPSSPLTLVPSPRPGGLGSRACGAAPQGAQSATSPAPSLFGG